MTEGLPPALNGPSWELPGPPVRRIAVEDEPAWLVTRYRDVSDALSGRYPLVLSSECADGIDYRGFRLPPGQQVRAGQAVLLSLAEANRDPEVFTHPHRLDLARRPNPHLSLGRGTHACPAATLTRQLLDVTVSSLLDQHPRLALVEADPPMRGNFRHQGPERLLVDLT